MARHRLVPVLLLLALLASAVVLTPFPVTAGGGGGNSNALTTEFIAALRALPLQIKLAMRGA